MANNDSVIRKLIAVGLSVALQMAALCAPLVHAHLDDHATDHHRAHAVHAHLSGHAALTELPTSNAATPKTASAATIAGTLEVGRWVLGVGVDDQERTVFLQLFVAVSAPSFDLPAAVARSCRLAVPPEAPAHQSVQVVHGHDPPAVRSLPSRAPPTLLS